MGMAASIDGVGVVRGSENFGSFTCGGTWVQDPVTANLQGYRRDCGDGYTALVTRYFDGNTGFSTNFPSSDFLVETDAVNGQPAV